MTETIDCAVIGAGVVGLAVARALSGRGREVVVLEAADAIGTGTSSRNSEVIHAGIYYPQGSLKARLCVEGNRRLRRYCAERGIAHRMTGKLIVAANDDEVPLLRALADKAHGNGVRDLRWVEAREAREMESELACAGALHSPSTGIVDSHALMLSLQGDMEERGGTVAFLSPVTGGSGGTGGVRLDVGGREPMALLCRSVVNCAGLGAQDVSRRLGAANVPPLHLCKGNYFTLSGRTPFERLVYPVPGSAGLGVHFTLDLAGRGRFGPDVEWVERPDYHVAAERAAAFYGDIRRYWPGLPDGALEPGYAGIRPKVQAAGEPARDFVIHGPGQHGVPGLVALYGIESPGLTACLALAEHVADLAA